MNLENWFPLPLTMETLVMFILMFVLASAGGLFGIAVKHYQSKNWKFGTEDIVYYMMAGSVSLLFLVSNTPPAQCFTIPAAFNTMLGVVRNIYDQRKNGDTREQLLEKLNALDMR